MKDIITVIFSLFGVIVLIFLTYFSAKWLNKRVKFSNSSIVKVHERINLGADKAILVASVGTKYMLLGVTQENINKISDLEKDDIEKMIEEKKESQKQSFSVSLANAIVAKKRQRSGGDNDKN